MVYVIAIVTLLVGEGILLPRIITNISQSSASSPKQKSYKYAINICIGLVLAFILGLGGARFLSSNTFSAEDPLLVRDHLSDIDIKVDFPEFTVERHTFKVVGGDDTEEWWEIEFTQPLPQSFIAKLDSLCRVDHSRWTCISQGSRPGVPYYEFSYWNQDMVEFRETITIFPSRKIAWLSHYKM